MERYQYAEAVTERLAGVKFTGEVRRADVDEVRGVLERIADRIGAEAPEIEVPRKNFLVKELTRQQRQDLNTLLTPRYAEQNVAQQAALRQVPIEEGRVPEPMVPLETFLADRGVTATFSTKRIHEACGEWAEQQRVFWLRRSVAEKVATVCAALNDVELMAHIEDCWRHEDVQEGLFIRRIVQVARDWEPDAWDADRVKTVSMSFTAASPGLAGHMAGAAVDLRLRHLRDHKRQFLPLGNNYPDSGAVSSLDFPYLTFGEWRTRVIFEKTMQMAGLKLLRTENWHASHGDRGLGMDGGVHMRRALFGPIHGFDADTGAVRCYQAEDIDRYFLADNVIDDLVCDARDRQGADREAPYRYGVVELADRVRAARPRRKLPS